MSSRISTHACTEVQRLFETEWRRIHHQLLGEPYGAPMNRTSRSHDLKMPCARTIHCRRQRQSACMGDAFAALGPSVVPANPTVTCSPTPPLDRLIIRGGITGQVPGDRSTIGPFAATSSCRAGGWCVGRGPEPSVWRARGRQATQPPTSSLKPLRPYSSASRQV
jgi:hypothetical protein